MRVRLIVFCSLCLVVAAANSQESRNPKKAEATKADGSAKSDKNKTEAPPVVVNVVPPPKTQEETDEDRRERKEKAELDRKLVELTADLAWFTAGLFAATAALVVATGALAYYAFRQSRDMRESISAAKDSADIARLSLISTQRAYVRVANFPWLWRSDLSRPGKFFYDITPIVENGGNTQTVDAKINLNSRLTDAPLPEGFDFPFPYEPGFTLIGARQTVSTSHVTILDDDLLLVQSGEKFFYIWGTIAYRDVFPETPVRVTEFCTQINRVMGNPLDPREPNNPKGTTLEIYFRIYPEHQKTT
jgi:hypothetical protein